MIASAHLAAGAVIGLGAHKHLRWRVGSVVASLALGILLHLAMDAVPHADYKGIVGAPLLIIVGVEVLVTLNIGFFVLRDRLQPGWIAPLAAGLVGSSLPDAKFFAPVILPADAAEQVSALGEQLHYAIHAAPTSLGLGMATQLTTAVLLLGILMSFPRTPKP